MRFRRSLVGVLVLAASLLVGVQTALAQDGKDAFDDGCLSCHAGSEAVTAFGDGEERSVGVDIDAINASVHGSSNPPGHLSCFDCHGDYRFPHAGDPFETARDFRLELNQQCERCHSHQAELESDGTHAAALAAGNPNAAVCVDCHGSHEVSRPGEPRGAISQTCGQCHVAIFDQYSESVHGAALLEESNPDVPTCIDCHGVHNIEDPTTNLFRLRSPQICAQCHADEELMERYDISTNVFDSYVADFHGTTVTLFEDQAPDAEVNKAVCYDCHGVHDIRSADDPESQVIRENLQVTCQKCHPDATANFPDAWLGHYEPTPDENSLVYFVNLFYRVFIPALVGFFVIVILIDVRRRIADRPARG